MAFFQSIQTKTKKYGKYLAVYNIPYSDAIQHNNEYIYTFQKYTYVCIIVAKFG